MSPHKNPYHPIDPDAEDSLFQRESVLRKLDGCLLHVDEPSCTAIIAERGMGGPAAVKQFLRTRADQLPVRVVECDVKSELGKGDTAADFYRALINFLWPQLDDLPATVHRVGSRLVNNTSERLDDLQEDLWTFFWEIRKSSSRLLLVFYSFDRLPHRFAFDELDWSLLRGFHNEVDIRIYYLLVSRRPLRYIEHLHNLDLSLFSTLFSSTTYRLGLLRQEEAWKLITEPAETILGHPPWPQWLAERIFEWGGRHPYCIQHICSELFDRIWIRGKQLKPLGTDHIVDELGRGLREYFDRLYENLENDELIHPLVRAVELGHTGAHFTEVAELLDLGYFLPEPAEEGQYMLFSPLFRDYLVRRGHLSPPPLKTPPLPPTPKSPKVQAILELDGPSSDVRLWFEDYQGKHTRIANKPDVDSYTLLFLTGCEIGLSEEELLELRKHLFLRYRDNCEERGDRRNVAALRTYLYSECRRWRQRFEQDLRGTKH